jgi:ribonucleoside-diphosphate reductase subunit M1
MFNFLIYLDGRLEEVMMDKITMRIEQLCDGLNMDFIDPVI